MVEFVAYHDIACVYPISGQYNNIPRWLYYILLISVIILRRQEWLAVGAAATCLTYGGGAAVHALILASARLSSSSQIPNGFVQLPSGQEYWINAASLDLDTDGTLAVVGVGFLITLPMALWSSEFRRSDAKPILVLWTILMFIGMICCLVNLFDVDATPDGPYRQYRFCPASVNDSLSVAGGGLAFSEGDWNTTIWKHFSKDGAAYLGCVYPCFGTQHILRSQNEMIAITFPELLPSNPQYWGVCLIAAFVYGFVPVTMLLCLAVLILNLGGFTASSSETGEKSKFLAIWHLETQLKIRFGSGLTLRLEGEPKGKLKFVFKLLLWGINAYAGILTPLTVVAFVIWIEWTLTLDIQAETYRDVGQWTPPLYFGLVVVSTVIGKFWNKTGRLRMIYNRRRSVFENEKIVRSLLESIRVVWKPRTSHNGEEATGVLELQLVDQGR
jgi:hypothetical protein